MKPIHWLQIFGCFIVAVVLIFTIACYFSTYHFPFYFLVIGTLLSLILIGIGEVARQLDALIRRRNDEAKAAELQASKDNQQE